MLFSSLSVIAVDQDKHQGNVMLRYHRFLVHLLVFCSWLDKKHHYGLVASSPSSPRIPWFRRRMSRRLRFGEAPRDWTSFQSNQKMASMFEVRGGRSFVATTSQDETKNDNKIDEDEERYSRQVYTLGARAHKLIRSSIVYLDGPLTSGLLYETAKNLALSGVGRIVIVVSSTDSVDQHYHNEALDDLGMAYRRAARAELGSVSDDDLLQLLVGYIRRLNPSVVVSTLDDRKQLSSVIDETEDNDYRPRVLMAIDRPFDTQMALNQAARQHSGKMAFVAVETAGVFGRLFCDFGSHFEVIDADGETPLMTPLDRLDVVSIDSPVVEVRAVEGEKHDVSAGDVVRFQHRDGTLSEDHFVVTKVHTPFRFHGTLVPKEECLEDVVTRINQEATAFCRVKMPQSLSFAPLAEAVDQARTDPSLYTPCDLDKSFDSVRRDASFASFQALSLFVKENGQLPSLSDIRGFEALLSNSLGEDKSFRTHVRNFVRGCAAKFVPVQCIFGAIGAQEAMKSLTGLYFPTRQFLLYDTDEVLPDFQSDNLVCPEKVSNLQAPGLRHIVGNSVANDLHAQQIFIVGAGAIGCELLKNLASLGIATREKGRIHLTDMDTIEKSNLSRQLLFRDADIGKFKSSAAHQAALRFNADMRISAHSSKVGASDQSPFDAAFWSESVDIVLNALDNVEARIYMDSQCVANEKALVDAGTMGPKGNVQVIVPHQSESYASSVDPQDAAVPVCTLKNFPYSISHTIQWARDIFDGYFTRRPNQANDFLASFAKSNSAAQASAMIREKGEEGALQAAEELSEDVVGSSEVNEADAMRLRSAALTWASREASKLFYSGVIDLLREHPLDSLDEDGEPFWTGTRRPPKPLKFQPVSSDSELEQKTINELLIEFVRSAARLRFETFCPQLSGELSEYSIEEAHESLASSDYERASDGRSHDLEVTQRVETLLESISEKPSREKLFAAEFEKDNDANGHVAFVNAASNLRAFAYGIAPVDAMETRRVAGNIVPAMITTTAFVSALSCIELIKLVQNFPLTRYRNAFVNLALPFFAFTVPLPAERMPGLKGGSYTIWDRVVVKESRRAAKSGGITMSSLLRRIKERVMRDEPDSVEVTSVSCGEYMLYANFLHGDDEEALGSSLWDLIRDAAAADEFDERREGDKAQVPREVDSSTFVDLSVVVEDLESGEEVELPTVRVRRFKEAD